MTRAFRGQRTGDSTIGNDITVKMCNTGINSSNRIDEENKFLILKEKSFYKKNCRF